MKEELFHRSHYFAIFPKKFRKRADSIRFVAATGFSVEKKIWFFHDAKEPSDRCFMLSSSPSFLLVGHDIPLRETLAAVLRKHGCVAISVVQPQKVPSLLQKYPCSGILFCPTKWSATESHLCLSWHEAHRNIPIFLFSADPIDLPSFVLQIFPPYSEGKISETLSLSKRKADYSPIYPNERIIAESSPLQEILTFVKKIASKRASVFLYGESGVGKEVIAQALHVESTHAKRPFIKINCAAIPDTLADSALFGHEKGAFTGAYETRKGHFERAHGGTLLLDEISEIPHSLQAKLLRVTQDYTFERVGGTESIAVDVRIISTSNRAMSELVDQHLLRPDLYYRLNTLPIHIPPLRERKEDILPLADYFIEKIAWQNRVEPRTLSKEAGEALLHYNWPGNVRELGHVIERAMLLYEEETIVASHLHFHPFTT